MATNFYKIGSSYYRADTGAKILNLTELQNLAKAGGKEISPPAQPSTSSVVKIPSSTPNIVKTSSPVAASPSTSSSTTKKATLYGPNNQTQVVDVGSALASKLQSQGWGLYPGSYRPPVTSTQPTTQPKTQPTTQLVQQTPAPSSPVTSRDAINNLYQKYFNRNATEAEINNWQKEPISNLDNFLRQEQVRYGVAPQSSTIPKAGGVSGDVPWDTATARQKLAAKYGADVVNQLDDNQVKYLGMGLQASELIAANDQKLNLADTTTKSMEAFLTSAAAYIDPRYQDQWNIDKTEALNTYAQITNDAEYLRQTTEASQKQEQENLQAQIAEAGLARSGLRRKAEEQLKTQQQGVVSSQRRQLQQKITDLGLAMEKAYGAKGASVIPGYTPIGIKYGSATEARNANIMNMAQNIAALPQLNVPAAPTLK
jgi:hypothetical protein